MGGFFSAMMEVAVAQTVVVLSRLQQTVATLEQKISFLAPVRIPPAKEKGVPLFCDAIAVKMGRSVAFFEVSLTDADGVLVARASQTTLLVTISPRAPSK